MVRSLKTLALRVQRQNENAMTIARWLASQPQVERSTIPGLETHLHHDVAARQMRGYGGMLSFSFAAASGGRAGLPRLRLARLPGRQPRRGGTVAGVPAADQPRECTADERARGHPGGAGAATRSASRTPADLIADLEQAFTVA